MFEQLSPTTIPSKHFPMLKCGIVRHFMLTVDLSMISKAGHLSGANNLLAIVDIAHSDHGVYMQMCDRSSNPKTIQFRLVTRGNRSQISLVDIYPRTGGKLNLDCGCMDHFQVSARLSSIPVPGDHHDHRTVPGNASNNCIAAVLCWWPCCQTFAGEVRRP